MPEFKDEYHPGVKRDLKKINRATKLEIMNFHIPKILNDPYNSEELKGDLAGVKSYHFKQNNVNYRISYLICDTEKIIYILMIRNRENFYKILKRRF